jgi:hypothetical protein
VGNHIERSGVNVKVYIVTADDIEDHYPEAVFYTLEEAQDYIKANNEAHTLDKPNQDNGYSGTWSYIVEHEVRHFPHD